MLSSMMYGNPPVENMMLKIHILLPVLLLGPLVWSQILDLREKSIKYISNAKNWQDAQAICRIYFSDLVTIRETDIHLRIGGWIGLYQDSDSQWKWSRGGEIANFTNWDKDHPKSGKTCAYKWTTETVWRSDECDDHHYFTCYDERLILVKQQKTWEEALQHCRALEPVDRSKPANVDQNHRYDLATLLTEDDHVYAKEKAQESPHGVWTGLRYLAGDWVWVGGEQVQYTEINRCKKGVLSDRVCGVLPIKKDKNFSLKNCTQKRNFLCYKKH